jgi:hypothetical protein
MVGIFLVFLGLLTLLFLFSSNTSASSGFWLTILGRGFGWGAYLFPIGLFAVGLWLVLRHFERIPQVSLERVIGVIFLFLALLTILHFAVSPLDRDASLELAESSQGGGYAGAVLFELLRANLGIAGTLIAILAWTLIALAFALDRPVVDLFTWLPPLFIRAQDWVLDKVEERRTQFGNGSIWRFPMSRGGSSQSSQDANSTVQPTIERISGVPSMEIFPVHKNGDERTWTTCRRDTRPGR